MREQFLKPTLKRPFMVSSNSPLMVSSNSPLMVSLSNHGILRQAQDERLLRQVLGSLLVFFIILSSTFLWRYIDISQPVSETPFSLVSIEPQTPQDYILLGQKMDINRADTHVLEALPGIGPALANRIVTYRETHGFFRNLDDLDHVAGIGPKTMERLRSLVKCQLFDGH